MLNRDGHADARALHHAPMGKTLLNVLGRRTDKTELIEALDAHAGLILRTAARITGSMADAEDIAQDLAEKLLRKPPRDVRSWPALLKTMAVNAAIDRTRRRRETGRESEPVTHESPETELTRVERAERLQRALSQLSERDAQLFSLCYLADLSHADIGRQLGMQPNAVSVALHRVRQRLAAILDTNASSAVAEGEHA